MNEDLFKLCSEIVGEGHHIVYRGGYLDAAIFFFDRIHTQITKSKVEDKAKQNFHEKLRTSRNMVGLLCRQFRVLLADYLRNV